MLASAFTQCPPRHPGGRRRLTLDHKRTQAVPVKYLWPVALLQIINIYCDLLFCLGLSRRPVLGLSRRPGDFRRQQPLASLDSRRFTAFEFHRILPSRTLYLLHANGHRPLFPHLCVDHRLVIDLKVLL